MQNFIRIWRENGHYIAEIPSLHIVDQGEDLNDLKKNLKEAIELTAESLVKDDLGLKGKKAKDAIALLEKPLVASLDFIVARRRAKPVLNIARA